MKRACTALVVMLASCSGEGNGPAGDYRYRPALGKLGVEVWVESQSTRSEPPIESPLGPSFEDPVWIYVDEQLVSRGPLEAPLEVAPGSYSVSVVRAVPYGPSPFCRYVVPDVVVTAGETAVVDITIMSPQHCDWTSWGSPSWGKSGGGPGSWDYTAVQLGERGFSGLRPGQDADWPLLVLVAADRVFAAMQQRRPATGRRLADLPESRMRLAKSAGARGVESWRNLGPTWARSSAREWDAEQWTIAAKWAGDVLNLLARIWFVDDSSSNLHLMRKPPNLVGMSSEERARAMAEFSDFEQRRAVWKHKHEWIVRLGEQYPARFTRIAAWLRQAAD